MTITVTVELDERNYPIVIGSGLIGRGVDIAAYAAGDDCLVVTDENVGPLYLAQLQACLDGKAIDSVTLGAGEAGKNLQAAESIIDALVQMRAGRDATVIALGGGVVGDIAGFAAACYMRGIAFIQVPTSLLAQVDSSVGGKTGVNHPAGKNLIGAFHQPRAVIVDAGTLDTLPDRELRAGLAEVIKYGAIADAGFFEWLEDNIDALLERNAEALVHAIRRSCELKAEIVAEDEREAGRRGILNFGHTFGHAIEHCQGYGEWLHGEAVAAGMVMAAMLSETGCNDVARLVELIRRAGLPVKPPSVTADALRDAMRMDKKALGGSLRFVLLEKLGKAYVTSEYDQGRLDLTLETAN